jgi:hypothetical protein
MMKNILISTLSILVVGCSVQKSKVPLRPPSITGNNEVFEMEYGSITRFGLGPIDSISVFLWPEGLNEEQARQSVRTVNRASNKIDEFTALVVETKIMQATFQMRQCETALQNPPTPVAQGEPGYEEYLAALQNFQVCQKISNDISVNLPKIVEMERAQVVDQAKTDIAMTVGPQNFKIVNNAGSSLSISEVEGAAPRVDVTLADFLVPGYSPSTNLEEDDMKRIRNVIYIPSRRVLMFDVPEVDLNLNLTGAFYRFAMERSRDFVGMARFKGDVNLISSDGALLRTGSVQIQGCMSDQCRLIHTPQ